MAYMNQEKKALIAAQLKKVIPSNWKWSLAVHHHSKLILTISAAPIDFFKHMKPNKYGEIAKGYEQLNKYHLEGTFDGALLNTFQAIKDAMNTGNWDRSDVMTDYFDVGHYVSIHIGRWGKPFEVIADKPEPTIEQLKARVAQLEAEVQS